MNSNIKLCQSCGMPFDSAHSDLIAKEKDGSASPYCAYCYKDGEFLAPDATVADMVEMGVPHLAAKVGEQAARRQLSALVPTLSRWAKQGMDFTPGRQRVLPFLTFNGNAEEAMNFYAAILPGARIEALTRFGTGQPNGDEGKVLNGVLSFLGQRILFMDMQAAYPCPAFSWSASLFITCKDEAEFDVIFAGLSQGGTVMMGPEAVMHIRKCAWVTDKFGVTWQPVWE